MRYFKALVTTDMTASAALPIAAEDAEIAADEATKSDIANDFYHCFEVNDGHASDLYLGDPDNDVTEISKSEYESLKKQCENDKSYILIQEGGSSNELYVHAHETEKEAEADRLRCAEEGSYRTSPVMAVPKNLAQQDNFYEVLESVIRLTLEIDYPDGEDA